MKKKRSTIQPTTGELTLHALEYHKNLISPEEYNLLIQELERPLYSAIRINPLKARIEDVPVWAKRYGWTVVPVPYCPTAWWITSAATPPGQTMEHRLGAYYIQDAASMLPVELFDLQDVANPLILDMAASPGGKTTHLISRTHDHGMVIANDSSLDRVTALRLVLQTWGAVHTAVTNFPGEKFGGWFPETFDRILLDAPCSMQNLRSTESHPMRPISEKERSTLSMRQTRLLTSAFQALKIGGQVVYATCTLAPEEDEAVLDNLILTYGQAVQINDLSKKLPAPAPGLSGVGERLYHPDVQQAARLYPHRFGTSGFFCALLTKTAPVETPDFRLPSRPIDKTSLVRLDNRDSLDICHLLLEAYGIDLAAFLNDEEVALWQRHEQIYMLPETWISQFGHVPFQAVGLLLGETSPEGFIPSHEWITRFAPQFQKGRAVLAAVQAAAWLHGEDIQGAFTPPAITSHITAVFDEENRFLGRGKVFTGRLKNLLPRRIIF